MIPPAQWQILDRMVRAGCLLAWQRGNAAECPETAWWDHGIYSLYQVPRLAAIRDLAARRLIETARLGDPPANVWYLRPSAEGRRVWAEGQSDAASQGAE